MARRDPGRLERRADAPGEIGRARRVAVQTHGVGAQLNRRAVWSSSPRPDTICTARSTTTSGIVNDAAGHASRGQRSVGFVGAIGEDLGRDSSPAVRPRSAARSSEGQRESASDRTRPLRGRWRAASAASRTAMLYSAPCALTCCRRTPWAAATPASGGHLIEHRIFDFVRRELHLATAEPDEIGKARMRADRHAIGPWRARSCAA